MQRRVNLPARVVRLNFGMVNTRNTRRAPASGVRAPLQQVEAGLPATWYHDPDHYRRELARIWSNTWIAAARESELAGPGDFRVVDIGDQSILLLRSTEGGVRAFHNTCRHRGSILCTEAQGRLRDQRIVCPYHAWSYDLEGRLCATPHRMPVADFDLSTRGLFPVQAGCWGGFVFVHLGGPATGTAGADTPGTALLPLAQALGDLPVRFARYRLDRLAVGPRIVVDVKANWKLICENFCECLHCPPVHPELCRIVPAYREAGAWGLHQDGSGTPLPETTPEYRPGAVTLTLDGSARVAPFACIDARERATLYAPALLPPNLFLNVHPDYVNSHMMFPTGPETVRIVYDWLFEPEALGDPAFDLEHYVALWRTTNAQDARNCEWQQRGVHAAPFTAGQYMPQEFDCHRFAQWVRAALRATRPRQRPI